MYLDWQLRKVSKISKHGFWTWKSRCVLEVWGVTLLVMPCLKRTLTCYAQQNPTQGHPTSFLRFLKKFVHIIWRKCFVHRRIKVNYIVKTNCTDAQKPCQNNRSKQEPDSMSAIMLKCKEAYQNYAGNWKFYICKRIIKPSWVQSQIVKWDNQVTALNLKAEKLWVPLKT